MSAATGLNEMRGAMPGLQRVGLKFCVYLRGMCLATLKAQSLPSLLLAMRAHPSTILRMVPLPVSGRF
jgi:hypothetical protein